MNGGPTSLFSLVYYLMTLSYRTFYKNSILISFSSHLLVYTGMHAQSGHSSSQQQVVLFHKHKPNREESLNSKRGENYQNCGTCGSFIVKPVTKNMSCREQSSDLYDNIYNHYFDGFPSYSYLPISSICRRRQTHILRLRSD